MTLVPPSCAVSHDAFLGGRLTIQQARNGLRAGVDAVFLSASIPGPEHRPLRILDVGTGCGIVGLCALARAPEHSMVGIEQDATLVALAQANAATNGLSGRARFELGDVCAIAETMSDCGLTPNTFDHVVANPPFYERGAVQHAPDVMKDRANVMEPGDLHRWVRFMVQATRAGGTASIVHTPAALPTLLSALEGRFGDVIIFPLFPRVGEPAHRVLVQARKGSRSPMSLRAGMVLHNTDGSFTMPAERVLRHGEALRLS